METNTTVAPPRPENYTHNHHHSQSQPHHLHHHNTLSSTSILIIIFPIITIALLLITVMLCRRKSAKNDNSSCTRHTINGTNRNCMFIAQSTISINSSPDVKGGCLYGGNSGRSPPSAKHSGVQVYTYKELELATDQFSEANVIGNEGFGVVYKGVLCDGTVAAIKKLHRQGKQGERAFRIEVDLLSRLHSPYLTDLLGYCADQHHRLLVFEFMPNGTLYHHLHPARNQSWPLNWGTRLRIALDCGRALEFLHEHSVPSIIHRDFKSRNVLLDQNFRAKVSDFGLAKTGSDKINGLISTRVMGTTGYLAPESTVPPLGAVCRKNGNYENDHSFLLSVAMDHLHRNLLLTENFQTAPYLYASTGKLTTKSDVYSYGVVLLELLTGRVPIDTNRSIGEHVLVSWALPRLTNREKVLEMVDPSLKGQYSKKDLIQVAAIAAMCVQPEADYRPLMTDVVQSLIPLVKNLSSVSLCPSSTSSLRFSQRVTPKY